MVVIAVWVVAVAVVAVPVVFVGPHLRPQKKA